VRDAGKCHPRLGAFAPDYALEHLDLSYPSQLIRAIKFVACMRKYYRYAHDPPSSNYWYFHLVTWRRSVHATCPHTGFTAAIESLPTP
jgi:hypothetical protein